MNGASRIDAANVIRSPARAETFMNNTKLMVTVAALAVLAVLAATALQARSRPMDPAKVQRDIIQAHADGKKMIDLAQADLAMVNAQNNEDVVNAQVAARAHDPRNASTAAANRADARQSRAEARQRIVDARYTLDKARAEADHKVAKAQCETHVGAAEHSCEQEATANYESEIAAANAQKDAAHLHSTNNS
jgi:hypothetical protein